MVLHTFHQRLVQGRCGIVGKPTSLFFACLPMLLVVFEFPHGAQHSYGIWAKMFCVLEVCCVFSIYQSLYYFYLSLLDYLKRY